MVDKVTDADILKGGPGQSEDGKAASVTEGGKKAAEGGKKDDAPKTITIEGVEFPAEFGGSIEKLVAKISQSFSGEISNLKGQLQTLVATSLPAKGKEKDADDEYDFNTRLFENPKEALSKLEERIVKKVQEAIDKSSRAVEAKVTSKSQETEFWNEFYKDNPELKEHDFIAKAILNRDFNKLATKTVDEALKHIAQETKRILLKAPAGGGSSDKSKGVEGAGTKGGGSPAADDKKGGGEETEVGPETLTDFLKKRRADRRAGSKAA